MRNLFLIVTFALTICAAYLYRVGYTLDVQNTEVHASSAYSNYIKGKASFVNNTALKRKNSVAENVVKATVSIEVGYGAEKNTIGTGVIVNTKIGTVLLTAKHVALAVYPAPISACSITDTSDCLHPGSSFVTESGGDMPLLLHDWVIYKIDRVPESITPISLSSVKPSVGDTLWFVGMPWGKSPWVSKGNVAWVETAGKKSLMTATSFAAPGFSGGPVCNSKGDLVGITVAIAVNPNGELQTNQVLIVPLGNIWILQN